MQLTYSESGKFYAVVTLPNGHTFYRGPYNSRSTARRVALAENKRQRLAARSGMIVNYRI
jgi:hypothetical protein